MIEYLEGPLLFKSADHAVIAAGGVGYGADVTSGAALGLPALGETATLHVYLYVQEGILRLYGFASREERSVFELFLNTSGIGPKTALAILSSTSVGDFARAILQEDLKTLTSVPGIGKKTAERLVLELRDKMAALATPSPAKKGSGLPTDAPVAPGPAGATQEFRDAIEALMALGCKPLVAERAIGRAAELLPPGSTSGQLVKEGLKHRY